MRSRSAASAVGDTRDAFISSASRFKAAVSSPITQFAATFGAARVAAKDFLEIFGERTLRREHARVIGGQPVLRGEALVLHVGQLGQRRTHGFDRVFVDHDRQEIRVRECGAEEVGV